MKDTFNRQKKKINIRFCLAGAVLLLMFLTACGSGIITASADIDDTDIPIYKTGHSSIPELGGYLVGYESKYPYICADVTVSGYSAEKPEDDYFNEHITFTGEADITWQLYDSLPKLEEGVQARREGAGGAAGNAGMEADEAAGNAGMDADAWPNEDKVAVSEDKVDAGPAFRLLYYRFPLPEGTHALDIYETLKARYDTEDHPLCVSSDGSGTIYTFAQEVYEGDYIAYIDTVGADINLTVKDGIAYGLILMGPEEMKSDESIRTLFSVYNDQIGDTYFGWVLDEEDLYWIDHEERTTVLEDGSSFLEVRGTDWGDDDRGFLSYFGMLKDADYEVTIAEGEKPLSVHFALDVEYSLKGELTTWLLNGSCVDERYNMTVTDLESGERLQALWVDLCVEAIDTVTFTDLNADGCLDIQIDKPTHWNGIGAVMDEFASYAYLLWNPAERIFERKSADEVRNSLLANMNGLTEEEQDEKTGQERPDMFAPLTELPDGADPDDYIELTGEEIEYVVQPGDCLWSISERLLGSGYDWPFIKRAEDAPKDPNYLLPGEIVTVPQRLYIPKDPYSGAD